MMGKRFKPYNQRMGLDGFRLHSILNERNIFR